MSLKKSAAKMWYAVRVALTVVAVMQFSVLGPLAGNAYADSNATITPIKHVIVIIGENRTFDHIFATYQPKPGESVNNLLSEGIITTAGAPGTNYALAHQFSADVTGSATFQLSPT